MQHASFVQSYINGHNTYPLIIIWPHPNPSYPSSRSGTRGIWSTKLFDIAALPSPGVVGWSGILERKISRWFLKSAKSLQFSFLRDFGSKLKR